MAPVLARICDDYGISEYASHEPVTVGYDDFNLVLHTIHEKYFLKVFASRRSDKECYRFVDVIMGAIRAGVRHPRLFRSDHGFLHLVDAPEVQLRLCMMEFVGSGSLSQLGVQPTMAEMRFIGNQAARIHTLDGGPWEFYDTWAVPHFLKVYAQRRTLLSRRDDRAIAPLVAEFAAVDFGQLPHCFIHADIIRANVIRTDGDPYIIDFSVGNYYPRIQELAVLCSDLFFDAHATTMRTNLAVLLDVYQQHTKLTSQELHVLPLFIRVCHALHLMGGLYDQVNESGPPAENTYWIERGRAGLQAESLLLGL